MEQIYTVKVKCRPNPELNYPSERAYSSSTVGGLAIVHFFLAILSTTLCSVRYSASMWRVEFFGGTALIVGAVMAGMAGVLAYKRWYIGRYIRWFFVTAVISGLTALASASLTLLLLIQPADLDFTQQDVAGNQTETENTTIPLETETLVIEDLIEDPIRTLRHEITVHILLASIVELVWSLLSARIAWRGVKNSYLEKNPSQKPTDKCPDIVRNVEPKLSQYSDVVRELCKLQKSGISLGETGEKVVSGFAATRSPGDGLPLPESQAEYRQRIENFLASSAKCDNE